jgi:hypothetical protein
MQALGAPHVGKRQQAVGGHLACCCHPGIGVYVAARALVLG